LYYTYCKGAANPTTCGVGSNSLEASGSEKTVTVASLPYSTVSANALTYLSCYYHIKAASHTWKEGAKLKIKITKATDMSIYIYGGNSRENASIAVVTNNATASLNLAYEVDISTEAVIAAVPVANK
jgi:hypothetical protein